VNEDMRNHENKEQYWPRIQRLGNAITRVLRESVAVQDGVEKILAPEELATAVLDYSKGKAKEMPLANCIGISLLTNELLRQSGYNSSIINIHAIDKDGEERNGHVTAAVVADGWLIDPALLPQAKKVNNITFDKNNENYPKFAKDMEGIYLKELEAKVKENDKPIMLEYHQDKEENELKSLYLLDNGIRLRAQGNEVEGKREIIEASRLNPKSFYASFLAGNIMKNDNQDAAVAAYRQCASLNPDSYLANYYAAGELLNIANLTDSPNLMKEAYTYSKKAIEMQPDAILPAWRHVVIASSLKKTDESEPLAQKFYDSLPADSPYKKMFEPYLAKK
jgi:tetratricopeptide (TPR) repeat protein